MAGTDADGNPEAEGPAAENPAAEGPAAADMLDAVRGVEGELRRLVRRLRAAKAGIARLIDDDMAASTYTVLIYIAEHQPTRAGDLVDLLGIDKSVISRHIAALDQMGLVRRGCDPDDRRAQTLSLTGFGRRKVAAAIEHRRAEVTARLGGWSHGELESFARQLARFNADMED